jgi:hypothetical protein
MDVSSDTDGNNLGYLAFNLLDSIDTKMTPSITTTAPTHVTALGTSSSPIITAKVVATTGSHSNVTEMVNGVKYFITKITPEIPTTVKSCQSRDLLPINPVTIASHRTIGQIPGTNQLTRLDSSGFSKRRVPAKNTNKETIHIDITKVKVPGN